MIAYSGPSFPSAPNSTFAPGQALIATVVVASNASVGQPSVYNDSTGTTQVVADVFGCFSCRGRRNADTAEGRADITSARPSMVVALVGRRPAGQLFAKNP